MPGAEHSFMMFPLVVKPPINRDTLTFFLEKNNIETREMLPLTNQPYNQKLFGADLEQQFPVAKHINENGFYIGCHPAITPEELSYVISKFAEFFSEHRN